jgi:NitT/TauT family transport system substrate-binding protein
MPARRFAALLAVLALAPAGACARSAAAGGGDPGTLKIAYFQGAVAGPEAVVAANPDLAGTVPARLSLVPIDSGVAGISQLRGGAFPAISGVGNPPFVGAVAAGTPVKVVSVESLDSAGLVVARSIASDQDLVGKQIGTLVGSTLDFELRGWLKTQGLAGKVTVTSFPSEAAEAAAFKAGSLKAAYISQAFLVDLRQHGGRVVTTAADIAKLGYAAVNLLIFTDEYISAHHDLVQRVVCAFAHAQNLVLGDQATRYITPAAKYLGVAPQVAVDGTHGYPYIPDGEQLSWLQGADGRVASGKLVQDFTFTGQFLVEQGRAASVPTADVLAAHIDPQFVVAARGGACR